MEFENRVAPDRRYMELDVESISGHPKNVQAGPWLLKN